MRVIIVKKPDYSSVWNVYTKVWWCPVWIFRKCFVGDEAQERAAECAKQYINPQIIEVTE